MDFNMKCPYCENEMEQGFIQSGREAFWTRKKRKWLGMANPDDGDIVIAPLDYFFYSFAESYLCRRCRKVIYDYSTAHQD